MAQSGIDVGDWVFIEPLELSGKVTRVQDSGMLGLHIWRGEQMNEVFYHVDDVTTQYRASAGATPE